MSALPKPAPEVTFNIQGVPPSWSNRRLHWARRNAEMAVWRESAYFGSAAARVLAHWICADKRFGDRRDVEVVLHRVRLLDIDNAYSSVKPIVDGLKGQLIADDSPEWIDLTVRQVKVSNYRQQKTVITVKESNHA